MLSLFRGRIVLRPFASSRLYSQSVQQQHAGPSTVARGKGERTLLPAEYDANYTINAGCIVQRNPLLLKSPSEFEEEYEKYRLYLQHERARGVLHIDLGKKSESENKAAGKGNADSKGDSKKKATSPSAARENHQQSVEDVLMDDGQREVVPRVEEDNGDLKSLTRRADRKLYLVARHPATSAWGFPMAQFTGQVDSLHMIARQIAEKTLGTTADLYHVGRAPVAFCFEPFPDRSKPPLGTKTFFFRAQLIGGRVRFDPSVGSDFAWLCKEELAQLLPAAYFNSVKDVLSY